MNKYNILSKMLSNKQKNLYKKFGETNIRINDKSYIQILKRDIIYNSINLHNYNNYTDYLNSNDYILNHHSYIEYSFSLLDNIMLIDDKLLDKILITLNIDTYIYPNKAYNNNEKINLPRL